MSRIFFTLCIGKTMTCDSGFRIPDSRFRIPGFRVAPKNASKVERIALTEKRHEAVERWKKELNAYTVGNLRDWTNCKRTAAGHLKYFRRVHNSYCNPPKVNEQPKKINEYFEPTEKREKILASDEGPEQSCLFQTSDSLLENIT